MKTVYLAHSAKKGCPGQTYADHIQGVFTGAVQYAREAERYAVCSNGRLVDIVRQSAPLHDLGKLAEENQQVLRGEAKERHHLPTNHVDAGCAALKKERRLCAALAVYAHHKGLPDMAKERIRGSTIFRDKDTAVQEHVDAMLEQLLQRHRTLVPLQSGAAEREYDGDRGVFFRMVLSCLADADHTDTAAAYGQAPERGCLPQLRAEERLAALDRYVSQLGGEDTRSQLRQEMYQACRDAEGSGPFFACDSPVGSGKTTAVMAHLLRQASRRGARHIFVVLPYTSIIQQSVAVYRKALVLPGEDPEGVVAELHARADFEDDETRYLTALWRAPIIVTTSVAFFETMASNRPATLRRFHELPGSVIFVDEAHHALPLKLMPLGWHWMNVLAAEWGCAWVLASGSLVRYWQLKRLEELHMPQPVVSELVPSALRARLMEYEQDRVTFRWAKDPISRKELITRVQDAPGPRLVILNTVQSAAVIAEELCQVVGRAKVEHLSTALTPEDRGVTIRRIQRRLTDASDTDWTLVATSCVEAGVDFSFRTGFRELASLLSLLQAAGRVNRHGTEPHAELWSFTLQDDSRLRQNQELACSRVCLERYFTEKVPITPALSTRALNDEIVRTDSCLRGMRELLRQEKKLQFQTVEGAFQVIESDTVTAIVDETLAEEVARGEGDWKALQRRAVSIRRSKIGVWKLKEIVSGVYQWTLGYDTFLGYMRGVLDECSGAHG